MSPALNRRSPSLETASAPGARRAGSAGARSGSGKPRATATFPHFSACARSAGRPGPPAAYILARLQEAPPWALVRGEGRPARRRLVVALELERGLALVQLALDAAPGDREARAAPHATALSSRRAISCLGCTPTSRSTSRPSFITSSVGIERSPKRAAVCGLSSTFSFTARTRPAHSPAS